MTIENLRFINQATSSRTFAGDAPPEISIVIPTLSRPYQVLKLLQSIFSQRDAPQFEILVVSNLEDQKLLNLVTLLSLQQKADSSKFLLKLFVVGVLGVNRARNLGIEVAAGNILLFIDDDCVMDDPDYLAKLIRAHKKYPQTAAIGGRYTLASSSGFLAEAYHFTAENWLNQSRLETGYSFHLLGGNTSYKSSYLNGNISKIRFNEDIEFGGSETELHFRLAELGYKMFLSENLPLRHECRVSLRDLIYKGFKQGKTSARLRKRSSSGDTQIAETVNSPNLTRSSSKKHLAVKFGLWIYRAAFEMGENQTEDRAGSSPTFWALLHYSLGNEIHRAFSIRIFPILREFLYIARLHFEKKRPKF